MDGKLEISGGAAKRLTESTPLAVDLNGVRGQGTLVSMPCTCRDVAHVHYFLESESFRTLSPETEVEVRISGDGSSAVVTTV